MPLYRGVATISCGRTIGRAAERNGPPVAILKCHVQAHCPCSHARNIAQYYGLRVFRAHMSRRAALIPALRPTQRQRRPPEPFVFPSNANLAASSPDCQFFFDHNLSRTCDHNQAARNTSEIENGSLDVQTFFREYAFHRLSLPLTDLQEYAPLRGQPRAKRGSNAAIGAKPVGATVQRCLGLIPAHFRLQTIQFALYD